jgi:c(7)-type cytochrome triheme protein
MALLLSDYQNVPDVTRVWENEVMKHTRTKLKMLLLVLFAFFWLTFGIPTSFAVPGDIIFSNPPPGSGGISQAFFPHWIHRIRYRCYVCHNKLFTMKKGSNPISMAKISRGEYCGACHNGKIAFNVEFQSCARCHPTLSKAKP